MYPVHSIVTTEIFSTGASEHMIISATQMHVYVSLAVLINYCVYFYVFHVCVGACIILDMHAIDLYLCISHFHRTI